MKIAIVIPRVERGIYGEEVVATGLRDGFRVRGVSSVATYDERSLRMVRESGADLYISLTYSFNPASVGEQAVCFYWNLHSPHQLNDLGRLRYDAYFLNATRAPHDVACGPIYLLEPGGWLSSLPPSQRYRCRAVYVGNYANRSVEEWAHVLDELLQEDLAIWGIGDWDRSPWAAWHRGVLPAEDLIECFSSADFVVNVTPRTRRENDMMPMRVVQAFACGRPVISDFLPLLQERYPQYTHFHRIQPEKATQVGPEVAADHSWDRVAATLLEKYAEFKAASPRPASRSHAWLWDTRFGTASSLDIFSEESVKSLERAGADIRVSGPMYSSTAPAIKRIARKGVPAEPEIYVNVLGSLPQCERVNRFRCPLIYVFWAETTTILPSDVEYINTYRAALVQSEFSRRSLLDSGVSIPVIVFPHGYDPDVFRWTERDAGRPFTFLQVGIIQKRKGTDLLLKVFAELFGDTREAQLILKSRGTDLNPHMKEMRQHIARAYGDYTSIRLIEEDLTTAEIADLYGQCDMHVYPSRGDGFAMPLLEGAATGLPVIATAHGGYMDYLNAGNAWLIPVAELSRRDDLGWTHNCLWAEPDIDVLRQHMWAAWERRSELPALGRHLYETVRESWTWDAVIARCAPQIEALAAETPVAATAPGSPVAAGSLPHA